MATSQPESLSLSRSFSTESGLDSEPNSDDLQEVRHDDTEEEPSEETENSNGEEEEVLNSKLWCCLAPVIVIAFYTILGLVINSAKQGNT